MKNDDLERLEKSQDVQQLIHFAKEQYEQEKSEHTPADFSSLSFYFHFRNMDKTFPLF